VTPPPPDHPAAALAQEPAAAASPPPAAPPAADAGAVVGPGVGVEVRTWRGSLPAPRVVAAVNRGLDRLVRPTVTVAGHPASTFRLCGYAGLVVAVAVSQAVVAAHGRSPLVMAGLTVTAVATFLVLVMVTTLVVGEEVIVYFHHQVAVLTTCLALLWVLDEPILAYLDAVLLGVGGFLLCGRVGCLLVGCCHGRPARLGARYRQEHADHGFPAGYVGVRLLPVPVVESLAVAGIVAVGIGLVAGGAPPGQALVWYVVAYGAVRSWLELLRGDGRPQAGGISHGQWTGVALVAGTNAAVGAGLLPGAAAVGPIALAVTVAAALVAWARWRRSPRDAEIHSPRHLAEVAGMLRDLAGRPPGLHVTGPSSAGVVISGTSGIAGHTHDHYGLSAQPSLSPRAAHDLAQAVLRARHPEAATAHLIEGTNSVHHLLV